MLVYHLTYFTNVKNVQQSFLSLKNNFISSTFNIRDNYIYFERLYSKSIHPTEALWCGRSVFGIRQPRFRSHLRHFLAVGPFNLLVCLPIKWKVPCYFRGNRIVLTVITVRYFYFLRIMAGSGRFPMGYYERSQFDP